MLELDYFHRENNPLGVELSALLRWVAADALGSDFDERPRQPTFAESVYPPRDSETPR